MFNWGLEPGEDFRTAGGRDEISVLAIQAWLRLQNKGKTAEKVT